MNPHQNFFVKIPETDKRNFIPLWKRVRGAVGLLINVRNQNALLNS